VTDYSVIIPHSSALSTGSLEFFLHPLENAP